jgi:protein gp37
MEKTMTKIQWTDQTANPVKEGVIIPGPDGCVLLAEEPWPIAPGTPVVEANGNYCIPISPGCANCYASKLNAAGTRFGGNGRKFGVRREGHPEMWLDIDMLQKWRRIRKPRRIFVGSMTDVFGEWVPEWMIFAMLDAMANSIATFQLLTKRPQRMSEVVAQWLRLNGRGMLPANIWVGTSAEDQQWYNERIKWLGRTLAQVRFLSLEPLLGSIDLAQSRDLDMVEWVIIGGESGSNARPCGVWDVDDILQQCKAAGTPAFVKQLGGHWAKQTGAIDKKGGNPDEWPRALRVRKLPGETRGL